MRLAARVGPSAAGSKLNSPRFIAGVAGDSYTVTISNEEQIQGMFNQKAGVTLTINPVGSGSLKFVNSGTPTQGIINGAGSNLYIYAPITGGSDGTIINPNNGGNVYLYGPNTYTAGTSLTSTATLIYFNSSSSFGTGTININVANATGLAPLLATGGTTVTIPNNFAQGTSALSGAGINFAADANTPLVLTGNWNLGAKNLGLRNNGVGNSTVTLSGVISGTAGVVVSSNSFGVVFLTGANTYTGPTTVTGPGAPAGIGAGTSSATLVLGAANTIATSSSVVLAGGILDPNGINQSMPSTTLNLSGTAVSPATTFVSTIDYTFGASEVDFANSASLAWAATGLLNLESWDPTVDKLRFGTNSTGLTATQLAAIEFNSGGLGTAHLDSSGYVVFGAVPGLPGDYNQNGVVDAADYVLWRKNVGQPAGTLPNDTTGVAIGNAQYDLWRQNFGHPGSGSGSGLGANAVPEPSSIALLMVGIAALGGRRLRD